jgi:hypothetical protein
MLEPICFSSTAVYVKSSKIYGLFALVAKHIACAQAIATLIPVKLPGPFVTAT